MDEAEDPEQVTDCVKHERARHLLYLMPVPMRTRTAKQHMVQDDADAEWLCRLTARMSTCQAAEDDTAVGGGSMAASDVASNVSVVGSTEGRRLASLMESPLEQACPLNPFQQLSAASTPGPELSAAHSPHCQVLPCSSSETCDALKSASSILRFHP